MNSYIYNASTNIVPFTVAESDGDGNIVNEAWFILPAWGKFEVGGDFVRSGEFGLYPGTLEGPEITAAQPIAFVPSGYVCTVRQDGAFSLVPVASDYTAVTLAGFSFVLSCCLVAWIWRFVAHTATGAGGVE